jgi:hypothetical protein
MTSFESFYSSIDATGPAITHMGPQGQIKDDIKLKICGQRLMIAVVGEPTGKQLLAHLREGLALDLIHPNMRVLIDLTHFVGVVDWTILSDVRAMAHWGDNAGHTSRTAYLLRDGAAAMMVKAISVLFPASQHRAFTDRQEAVAWLETAAAQQPA